MPLPTLALSKLPPTMFRSFFSVGSKSTARALRMRTVFTNVSAVRRTGLVVGSVTAATAVGVAWAMRPARAFAAPANEPTPDVSGMLPPTRDLSITEIRKADITLYQYEVCPFCNKVRAYLDYHRIPYRVVEVNPLTKKEIEFSKQYRKVPIVTINGKQLNDSDAIIDLLNAYLMNEKDPKASPLTAEDVKWRQFINTKLAKLVSPNLYRTFPEALGAFDYISTHSKYSPFEQKLIRYFGAATMYMIARSNKKKLGVIDERAAMYSAFNVWLGELGDKPFHGGQQPDLADLAIFGMARALSHFTVWPDVVANTKVTDWFKRMETAVGPSARLPG